ncbi:hypothetical protein [Roseinatronobacter sp.]
MVRLVLVAGLLMTVSVTWLQLAQHVAWQGLGALSGKVASGRFVPDDLGVIAPFLMRNTPQRCAVLRMGAPVTLNLYAGDLMAHALDTSTFHPSDDPALTSQRTQTQRILHDAIACAPMDGDLWLKLAIVARSLDESAPIIARYLAISQKFAPYEGWIMDRRAQLF